jgi:FPC/CPF motif-containing protein YcgG
MNYVDVDNLDLQSARRAIERARTSKAWCVRDPKNQNRYSVRRRHSKRAKFKGNKRDWFHQVRTSTHEVEFFFSASGRFAICRRREDGRICKGIAFGARHGKICFHIARAYFQHQRNIAKDQQRVDQKVIAA